MTENSKTEQAFGLVLILQLSPAILISRIAFGAVEALFTTALLAGFVGGVAARKLGDGRYLLTTPFSVGVFWFLIEKQYNVAPSIAVSVFSVVCAMLVYAVFQIRKSCTQYNP